MIDARLTPARSDLAAASLKGKVKADRYVDGVRYQVKSGVSPLRETPSLSARLETELLRGEIFTVYDQVGGWAWGQCERDGYVGYVRNEDFGAEIVAPTHRVSVLRTILFPSADIKTQPTHFLSMNAKVSVVAVSGRFARLDAGAIASGHLVPLDHAVEDWVASAELFLHTPYLWGGKDSFGLDCSGLVQTALETRGIQAPRDADMQEEALGERLRGDARLQRGDLVFWDGHVAIVRNPEQLVHANAWHMMVAIEPIQAAFARIGAPRTLKRLGR
ncbi:NlpC/P60 family protein [Terricaulis sp.]|uniref:C40 family peptidase n=1 Tax=Terricaulis sp. TaxID=2768686 RepID=UPI0037832A95